MELKEVFMVVALVAILQVALGAIIFFLFPSPSFNLPNMVVAILVMVLVAGSIASILMFIVRRYSSERSLRVAMMTLTEDERKVFEAILRAGGEARQDKLRRELDMSKAKLSALVNNLEKKRMVTKERYWKTNILRASKELTG
ncbi:MAG: helix-turn-helix transcriptional regulator [Candidatus Hadarchaeales archaeon]